MQESQPPFDRAAHLRKDLDFLEAQLANASTLLVPLHRDLHPLRGERLVMATVQEAPEWLDAQGELVWLGMYDQQACFGVDISTLDAAASRGALRDAVLSDLRFASARLPAEQLGLALYARALLGWHGRHGFCAVCGHASRARDGGHLRVCGRATCGALHFPRVDPCVLVLVTDEAHERCVLGRSAGWPEGMYSPLAGFVEPAETLEHAAKREVLEETGLRIDEPRYAAGQPWPFPSSLMLGFVATTRDEKLQLDDELEHARWFSRAELSALPAPLFVPGGHTLAGQLIERFVRGGAAAP